MVDLAVSDKMDNVSKNSINIIRTDQLENVINCLSDKENKTNVVPYDDSILTSLLKGKLLLYFDCSLNEFNNIKSCLVLRSIKSV